jgi:sialate O-acetylesterase
VPGYFEQQGIQDFSGVIWMRKEVNVPSCMAGKPAKLWLGTITDSDDAYINGEHIGATAYRYPPRKYEIPKGLLQEGKNIITLRVVSNNGQACFTPDKKYALFNDEDCISLEGAWKYKIGAVIAKKTDTNWVNWKPTALYNGMLSPIIGYGIKGAIWYQGESNTDFPEEYESLFKTMIKCWRENWKQGNFPFLYVQLPNFMPSSEEPQQSKWAELRQAQLNTLQLPNTGMIVGIDIGEWNDLHPLNKKAIGSRLGLLAQQKVYGESINGTSPVVESGIKQSNKIILSFNTVGSGLVIKGDGDLKHFAIAGADNKYVWANAKIEDNKVIVWKEDINDPVSVRYAWADNPDSANLYTKEGLPAAPFQLDM